MRALLNRWRRALVRLLLFRTVFGERAAGGHALPAVRISPSACIEHAEGLHLEDDVFIGHFCLVEAGGGVRIGAGTQVCNHVSIVTHSTHRSVRLGRAAADVRAPVALGQRCFVGPHSVIEAGAVLGHGCVVAAHSRVRGRFGDFALIAGSPARVVGDVRDGDERWLAAHPGARAAYDAWRSALASQPSRPPQQRGGG